jgi:outer membrane autotransporter protein
MDRDAAGVISGLDARFGNWRLGVAGGYTSADVSVPTLASSANVDSFHLAGYAGARHGAWGVRAGAAVAWHEIDTSRSVIFPGFADQLRASYDGTTAQAFGEVGYVFTAGRVAFEAFAGLAWVSVGAGGFVETGGAAALTGFDGSHDVGYSTIGLRAATSVPLANGMVLIPRASAAWQHAFDDTIPRASLAFLGTGTGFTIAGVPIARDSALVDAGFDLAVTANATLGLSYVGQLADGAQDHAVRGKAVWRF